MAQLRYLLDEHLRRALWVAIQQHNRRSPYVVDVLRVGDSPDLPLGSIDPDILLWAEREGRILVSRDRQTLPGHLASHLRAGSHSPGIFLIGAACTIAQVVDYLALAAYAGDPTDYQDYMTEIR